MIHSVRFTCVLDTNVIYPLWVRDLPDNKDKHMLAAAIKTNADLIITNNLKGFPQDYISSFGLSSKCPDDFFTDVIDLNHEESIRAFRQLVFNKRSEEKTSELQSLMRISYAVFCLKKKKK